MPVEAETATDGRRARRQRGRLAVTDAMIDLVFEGYAPPTAEQVAERAGVSAASLFRYFDTLDDLRRQTTNHYFDRYAHLFEIPDAGEGTLAQRISTFVAARVRLYGTTEPMCRLVRARAPAHAEVGEMVRHVRATRADQIRLHFDAELASLSPAVRDDIVAIVSTLTSFESWDQIRHDHDRTPQQIRRAWVTALTRIIQPSDGR